MNNEGVWQNSQGLDALWIIREICKLVACIRSFATKCDHCAVRIRLLASDADTRLFRHHTTWNLLGDDQQIAKRVVEFARIADTPIRVWFAEDGCDLAGGQSQRLHCPIVVVWKEKYVIAAPTNTCDVDIAPVCGQHEFCLLDGAHESKSIRRKYFLYSENLTKEKVSFLMRNWNFFVCCLNEIILVVCTINNL